ncbi:MAG: Glycerophosphoryl diester phosphodiesterase [uncultured Nocardioidaceae bacterium]|uniref:Glycerophosphoryl diester phosphodiesterase n=1 Tax=uncultured Nocardioidaceae bacterium TaxID=253824 RepID=A0A6J4MKH4_9ACTN|nr:MAG: Glycerophosphoryl diester phosphodiesterase [uncultured Nocardioidaceae bacterium]
MTTTLPLPSAAVQRGSAPWCVAHRGASDVAPENTLAAVRAAVAAGADHIEIDVRRTADRALVLHHDASLARTTDVQAVYPDRAPWRVGDFTLAELTRLDAGTWFAPTYAGEPVPTLEQVLDVLRGTGVGLMLELKEPGHQPGVVSELASELRFQAARPASPRVLVQSFDHQAMALFKACESAFDVGLIGKPRRTQLARLATWAAAVNPHHYSVDAEYVEAVKTTGMRCMVWTPNSTRSMRRALRLGVDAVTTDRPAQLRELLPVADENSLMTTSR